MIAIFVFIFIVTQVWGIPLPLDANSVHDSQLSIDLRNLECTNKTYIAAEIKRISSKCNSTFPPYDVKYLTPPQFSCYMFYDVSRRLCSNDVILDEIEFANLMNKKIEVPVVCKQWDKWEFNGLEEYPFYKHTAKDLLQNSYSCYKTCGIDDIFNDETNFFCKYYYWGYKMLSSNNKTTSVHKSLLKQDVNKNINQDDIEREENVKDSQNTRELLSSHASTVPESGPSVGTDKVKTLKKQTLHATTTGLSGSASISETDRVSDLDQTTHIEKPALKTVTNTNNEKPNEINTIESQANLPKVEQHVSKPEQISQDVLPNFSEMANPDITNEDLTSDAKDAILDKSLLKQDDETDFNDVNGAYLAEERTEVEKNSYTDDKKNKDFDDMSMPEFPDKPMIGKVAVKNDVASPSFENEMYQREFVLSGMQEGYAEDSNDHFFPMFLSAIVLVVLLYVLYHNKNKVTKVVLGLLVEGRQPGRRRNSRGHAYRRLDNLEQAMSTSTESAPPSKIIY